VGGREDGDGRNCASGSGRPRGARRNPASAPCPGESFYAPRCRRRGTYFRSSALLGRYRNVRSFSFLFDFFFQEKKVFFFTLFAATTKTRRKKKHIALSLSLSLFFFYFKVYTWILLGALSLELRFLKRKKSRFSRLGKNEKV